MKGGEFVVFEKDAEIMSQYEKYSTDELKEMLHTTFLCSELNEQDLAEMDQILAVLREREPVSQPHTTEEMWAEFQENHADELAQIGIREDAKTGEVVERIPEGAVIPEMVNSEGETGPKRKKKSYRKLYRRMGLVAAAVVAFMVVVTVTAGAMGFSLWGWIPKWNSEELNFEAEATPNEIRIEDIPSALAVLEIDEPLYPNWLPEDLDRTQSEVFMEPLILYEYFSGESRFLSITISPTSGSETAVYQKEGVIPLEYLVGGGIHYIFDNANEVTAVWNTEHYTTTIVGNITVNELKKTIDSVYEVKDEK